MTYMIGGQLLVVDKLLDGALANHVQQVFTAAESEKQFCGITVNPGVSRGLVAFWDREGNPGDAIGFLIYAAPIEPPTCYLYGLYVLPNHRCRSVAGRILQQVCTMATEAKCVEVVAHV